MSNESQKRSDTPQGNRHRSRILALQTLYACEIGENSQWQQMLTTIADGSSLPNTIVKYAKELLTECYASLNTTDELIRNCASNWDIKRMVAIDRNILRLAVTELSCFQQVPAKVVIDEAVELAKAFGTDDSGKFVNGIIDSIHKKNMNKTPSVSGKEGSLHGTTTHPQ